MAGALARGSGVPAVPAVTRLLPGTVALARAEAVEPSRCPGSAPAGVAEPVAR